MKAQDMEIYEHGGYYSLSPLFPTAVAIPFRGIGGHPVANFV
jgi:hypothetical protein